MYPRSLQSDSAPQDGNHPFVKNYGMQAVGREQPFTGKIKAPIYYRVSFDLIYTYLSLKDFALISPFKYFCHC